jgi:uncharacterized membrane protein YphA (DoxX/SURF4 family)
MVTGLLVAFHGLEVFKPEVMRGYIGWDSIKHLPAPLLMVYIGKGGELLAGLLLAAGLFTRMAALFICIDMLFICFKVAEGRFWYEDQHPFLFVLLALVFFFTGPIAFSLDQRLFKQRRKYY